MFIQNVANHCSDVAIIRHSKSISANSFPNRHRFGRQLCERAARCRDFIKDDGA